MKKELKTITGISIPEEVKGLVYLCDYDRVKAKLKVKVTYMTKSGVEALDIYANTPNPASQVALGNTREEFEKDLKSLHEKMKNKEWLKELSYYL